MFEYLPLEVMTKIFSYLETDNSRSLIKYRSVAKKFDAAYKNIVDSNVNQENPETSHNAKIVETIFGKPVCEFLILNFHTDYQAILSFYLEKCYQIIDMGLIIKTLNGISAGVRNDTTEDGLGNYVSDGPFESDIQIIETEINKISQHLIQIKLYTETDAYQHAAALFAIAILKDYTQDALIANIFLLIASKPAINTLYLYDEQTFLPWLDMNRAEAIYAISIIVFPLKGYKNIVDSNLSTLFDLFSEQKKQVFITSLYGSYGSKHKREFLLGFNQLMSACTNFILEENDISVPPLFNLNNESADTNSTRIELANKLIQLQSLIIQNQREQIAELKKRKLTEKLSTEQQPAKKCRI